MAWSEVNIRQEKRANLAGKKGGKKWDWACGEIAKSAMRQENLI